MNIKKIEFQFKEEMAKIKGQMEKLKMGDPFQDPDHVIDNASVDTDVREQEAHQLIEVELSTLSKRLNDIERAISRINSKKYGICARCSRDIPEKRLELLPEAAYCVDCEGKQIS